MSFSLVQNERSQDMEGLGVEKTKVVLPVAEWRAGRDRALGDPQRKGTVPSSGVERKEASKLKVDGTASCCPRPAGAEVGREAGAPDLLQTRRRPPRRC